MQVIDRRRLSLFLIFVFFVYLVTFNNAAYANTEIGRDGRFIAYSDGTVVDDVNGLMWAAKDNGEDINWSGAYLFCEEYSTGGYEDWRLPTSDELATLYTTDKKNSSGLSTTDLINLTSIMIWTSEQRACKAKCLDFTSGRILKLKGSRRDVSRSLPVRTILKKKSKDQ